MSIFDSIGRHWKAGTLGTALRLRTRHRARRHPMWTGRQEPEQAARGLAQRGREFVSAAPAGSDVLCLGDGGGLHRAVERWLRAYGVRFTSIALEQVAGWPTTRRPAAVLCAYPDARRATACVRATLGHATLAPVPFETVLGVDPDIATFDRLDEYADTFFAAPGQLDDPSPYELYQESLQHFHQKCGLRDFLDLYQLLKGIVQRNVPGAVAEFGSYEGHSGWLIARTLQTLRSDKPVLLFDTFASFPQETLGIDRMWSGSHRVRFADVQAKFAGFANVQMVRGEFAETVPASCPDVLALAHVDCDSYRATHYLFGELLPRRISRGGVLACEDYGHPALIGCRAAVHEALAGNHADLQWYSQFSGMFVVVRG